MPARGKRAREPSASDVDELTALHRSRLVDWHPVPVVALAPSSDSKALAVGCENGRVELWDAEHDCCLVVVPGEEDAELTSLAWTQDASSQEQRLFASRLDGQLYEVDFSSLKSSHSSDSHGGAVWCTAAEPLAAVQEDSSQRLAVGCDDGSIRVFSVEAGRPLQYMKMLAKAEGRTLALAWHPDGHTLVSGGSDGCIHCWDANTGQEVVRINAAAASKQDLCIWALSVLPDGTIVSGDSSGATQFWDGQFATLLVRLQKHDADVLALAASLDGSTVFASGIDSRVAQFVKVESKAGAAGAAQWAYLDSKRPHTHDVRALAVLAREGEEPLMVSAGNDTQLVLYNVARFQKEHPSRLTKCPQRPIMHIAGVVPGGRAAATQQPLLMSAQRNVLDIWQLAGAAAKASPDEPRPDGSQAEGDPLDLVTAPAHAARIKTAGGLHITCGAIAPNGSHIVVSDARKVRVFELQQQEAEAAAVQQLQVSSLKLSSVVPPATCMAFACSSSSSKAGSSDSDLLYCADAAGTIRAVDLEQGEVVAEAQFSSRQDGTSTASSSGTSSFGPEVALMAVSPDGTLLAAAGRASLRLFKLPGLQHHGDLLLQSQPGRATAMQFTGDSKQLAVIASGSTLEVYDVQRLAPTEWSLSSSSVVQQYVAKLPGSVAGLAASTSTSKHEVVVYTHGGMSHFDLDVPLTSEELSKKRQRQKQRPQEADMAYCRPGQNGRVLPLPEYPCLFASYLATDAMLLVEQPWEQVLQKLPAPLYRHRYGS